jgi:Amt family ammonium transporter
VITQLYGIGITAGYCAIATLVILKLLDVTIGLRVDTETERDGMDLALHGEVVQ